ncbi:MAG: hypothetical protein CMF62_03085 [Magnetococcales bacterium]|nr:hypothetical protein [Magnetococcales bacterium]|tara:strand:- start:28560 stop:29408 length:849 start_codon:yes stop_codon:yes gene_type:complete
MNKTKNSSKKLVYNTSLLYDSIKSGNKKVEKECLDNKVIPDKNCLILYISNYNIEMVKFCKSLGIKINKNIIKDGFDEMNIFKIEKKPCYHNFVNKNGLLDMLSVLKENINETDTVEYIFSKLTSFHYNLYYQNILYNDMIKLLEFSGIKLTKKILITCITIGKTHFDPSKYNIIIDDDIKKACKEANYYPFEIEYNDDDILQILKDDNKVAINKLDKKKYKFNSQHLRQCFVSSNTFKTYKIITETYEPTKADFEYCFNSLKTFKLTKMKMLRDMYNKTKN